MNGKERIPVNDVLDYLASGMTPDKILVELTVWWLKTFMPCLAYAENPNTTSLR